MIFKALVVALVTVVITIALSTAYTLVFGETPPPGVVSLFALIGLLVGLLSLLSFKLIKRSRAP